MGFISKFKNALVSYMHGKKRGVAGMKDLALGVGIAGIVIAITLLVLSNIQSNSSFTAGGAAYNAVGVTITAVTSIASWLGIIVVVAVGAYVLQYLGVFGGAGKVGGK